MFKGILNVLSVIAVFVVFAAIVAGAIVLDMANPGTTGNYEVVSTQRHMWSVKPIQHDCIVTIVVDGAEERVYGPESVCDEIQEGQVIRVEDGRVAVDSWTRELLPVE